MIEKYDPLKNGALALPGAHQLTLSGIVWAGAPSDEEFAAVDALRQTVSRVDAWMEGDVVAEYVRREQFKRPRATRRELIYEYAKGHESTPDVAYERYSVALFYPIRNRFDGLSWSHHRIVWAAGFRPLHRALAWLKRAKDAQLTPAGLRALLREDSTPEGSDEPDLEGFVPREVQNHVDYYASRIDLVSAMKPDEAARLVEAARPMLDYWDSVRALAAGKESITARG